MANETKKYASLESLQAFKTNADNLYATQTTVEELSADVAYINVEDNENVESPDVAASEIIIDAALSTASTNPVQNMVVAAEINNLSEQIAELNVQPDWNQSDETAADYVKNRTHYEKIIHIANEQTVTTAVMTELNGFIGAQLEFNELPSDVFDNYESITVVFDGVAYEYDNESSLGNQGILGGVDTGEPFYLILGFGVVITASAITATVEVYVTKIAKLNGKYLPDEAVQYGKAGEVTCIEWDGITDGLDTFVDNSCTFYKVSDFTVPYEHIASIKAERSDGTVMNEFSAMSFGCLVNGYTAAIVTDAENNNIPSNGLYFRKGGNDATFRCLWVEIDTRKENTALYLNNSSGVRYAITIDDNGTITATKAT